MFEDYPGQPDPTTFAINNVIHTLMGKAVSLVRGEGFSRADLPPLPHTEPIGVRDVRDTVAGQLEGYHLVLRDELRRGIVGPYIGAIKGTDVLELLLSKARLEGDLATINECVDTLSRMAREDNVEYSHAAWTSRLYVKASVSGSARAMDELRGRLHTEREHIPDDEGNSVYTPKGTYLLGAVDELSRQGLPAQDLIDEFAAGPSRRLAYYMKYLDECREHDPSSDVVDSLQEQIAELYEGLPHHVTTDVNLLTKLLMMVRSEQSRWSIFNTFRASYHYVNGNVMLGTAAYIQVMDALLLIPPSELDDDHRADLAQLADAGREAISGPRFEEWKIDSAVGEGRTPQGVVAFAQALIGADERRNSEQGQDQLLKEVDAAMFKYAIRFAAVDEFAAAQIFLEAISDPNQIASALTQCMLLTKTAHQRSLLHPGDMKMLLYPGLEVHMKLSRLLAENGTADKGDLAEATRDFALNPDASFGVVNYGSAWSTGARQEQDTELCALALQRLDPQVAIGLAREIKDELDLVREDRGMETQRWNRAVLLGDRISKLLVRLGEPDEIRKHYAKLHKVRKDTSTDPAYRWLACMDLADLLFDRDSVSP